MSVLRSLWRFVAGLFAGLVILLALAIGLFRLLLPLAPEFHGQIEAAASDFLQAPVRFERLDARWRFGGPELVLEGARILDDEGGALLEIDSGSVGISAMRWLRTREILPERVTLDGATIDVVRDADGVFFVLGRALGTGGARRRLPSGRFELIDASIVFRDRMREALPRVFTDVEINLDIDKAGLRVDGSVALPPDLGRGLVVSAEFSGDPVALDETDWQVYVSGDQLLLPGWKTFLPPDQPWFDAGGGDVEVWAAFSGRSLEQSSLRIDLDQITVPDPVASAGADYRHLAGRGEWSQSLRGWEFSVYDLEVDRGERGWQSALIRGELATTDAGRTQVLRGGADVVRLEDLVPLAAIGLRGEWRDRIAGAAPTGELRDVEIRLSRNDGKLGSYYGQARFSDLGVAPGPRWPGVSGLEGDARIDTAGGSIHLVGGPATVVDPQRFRGPLEFDEFGGTLVWRSSPGALRAVSDSIVARNADLSAAASVELMLPAGNAAPELDLRVELKNLRLDRARDYLPAAIMKPRLVDWLDNALEAGRAPTASLVLRGPLDRFPFEDGGGEFSARLALSAVDLRFNSNWPVVAGIDGEVRLDGPSLSADVESGTIAGNAIRTGTVRIDDLRKAVVEVDAQADGGVVPALDFLRTSPVGNPLRAALDRFSGDGDGLLSAKLSLPIGELDKRRVDVRLAVDDARVAVEGFDEPLEQIRGSVRWTDGTLRGDDIEAVFLGRPVSVDVLPEPVAEAGGGRATLVVLDGTFSTADIAARLVPVLAGTTAGESRFIGSLRLPAPGRDERLRVDVRSTLAGMALSMPAPLDKAAPTTLDSTVSLTLVDAELMDLDLAVGDARAFVELRNDGAGWRPWRGQVVFGGGQPERGTEDGIAILGSVDRIDVGNWLGFDAGLDNPRPLKSTLRSIRLTADAVDFFGQPLTDATISLDRSQREWLVQLDAPTAAGVLFVPFQIGAATPVVANFERLTMVGGNDDGTGDRVGDEPAYDPRKLPPMTIDVTEFAYEDMQFGVMNAEILKTERGVHLENFATEAPTFQLTGSGDWFVAGEGHQSVIEVELSSTDLESTLRALAFEGSVAADEARISMSLDWPGPPGGNFRSLLNGEVAVNVGPGKLLDVQPGAGRVFGLLSVAALPRRLSLDFTDVFDSGFGFDYIRGDFSLKDGNAYTSNLVLEGPAAQVGIVGRAGLAERDYDQTAVVYANFGATLPVAGAVVGGPAVGAALLVFSEIFKRPLQEMARVNYRITGSWDTPDIHRVVATDLAGAETANSP